MKLYFDVASFHKDVDAAAEENTEQVVDQYVDKLRAGEAADPEVQRRPFDASLARQFVSSLRPAPKLVFLKRMKACLGCDRARIIMEGTSGPRIVQCKECHCVMNAKARFSGTRCPLDRFPADAI